jgi:hypothetical protein
MSEESETAARYRSRAEALHAIADSTENPPQKLALERLAGEYESLAATFEIIDRSKQVLDRVGKT